MKVVGCVKLVVDIIVVGDRATKMSEMIPDFNVGIADGATTMKLFRLGLFDLMALLKEKENLWVFKWADEVDTMNELQFMVFERDTIIFELGYEKELLEADVKKLREKGEELQDQVNDWLWRIL
ncbi:Chaperone protein DnaK [Bienertia sinuspersici]